MTRKLGLTLLLLGTGWLMTTSSVRADDWWNSRPWGYSGPRFGTGYGAGSGVGLGLYPAYGYSNPNCPNGNCSPYNSPYGNSPYGWRAGYVPRSYPDGNCGCGSPGCHNGSCGTGGCSNGSCGVRGNWGTGYRSLPPAPRYNRFDDDDLTVPGPGAYPGSTGYPGPTGYRTHRSPYFE